MSTDEQLLAAWRAGERRAGEALFERHYESIARFFRNKVGHDAAPDLIQRTFLALVESRERFRGESSFRTFLFAVAHNVLGRHYRSKRRGGEQIDFASVSVSDLGPTPTALLARRDEEKALLGALRQIPIEAQVILELYFWERMKAAEIAAILGIPEGTARTRIRRAKQLLEQAMLQIGTSRAIIESTLSGLDRWAAQVREHLLSEEDEGAGEGEDPSG
ncbi:MAG: sigma-70 family RNA polymerase sigma factor [Myxococcales bacterium]|nr:sigma-70 family RNA polymerase sigma factor [Myxococcales bacterium]MCB9565717.1 sigma-70 family RNA polymerase sigma factor [Myxococcales bacterium]MCB9703136.1 sigma-70 family RNA polymerase sigma factor [Myxococcales bacterium]